MRVEGVALVVQGDNIDTDVMYPGAYLNVEDPEQMAQYLFEGFDPTLRGGSSRERSLSLARTSASVPRANTSPSR